VAARPMTAHLTLVPSDQREVATRLPGWPVGDAAALELHDAPHAAATLERWTFSAHLRAPGGQSVSIWVAFDRRRAHPREARFGHLVRWAINDPAGGHHGAVEVDRVWLEQLASMPVARDPALWKSVAEMIRRGGLPAPERRMRAEGRAAREGLRLHYGDHGLKKEASDRYRLSVRDPSGGFELSFQRLNPPACYPAGGRAGEDAITHRYVVPHGMVNGRLWVGREQWEVCGYGHYEHGFALPAESPRLRRGDRAVAARRFSIHLGDGRTVSGQALFSAGSGKAVSGQAIVSDQDGRSTTHPLELVPTSVWRSTRTYQEYPSRYRLGVPEAGLELVLEAANPAQERLAVASGAAGWSGRMEVKGTRRGKPVDGVAWLEQTAFPQYQDTDGFFRAVGQGVRAAVEELLPRQPSPERLSELIGCTDHQRQLQGIDPATLMRALFDPLRAIIDRGGKAWRSFAALACIDAVGGDSSGFVPWLAMPELIHVGSLIVDDVQDRSELRRGGPTCHLLFGEPLAINTGNAAYFLAELALSRCPLPAERAARVSRLYFEAMRAGHAGQALDIAQMTEVTRLAVVTGDVRELERRVMAINRLKTAVPAGTPPRMGAIAGGGSAAQVEAAGQYFESVALAFQIVDDVLNLRGFEGRLKQRGEDIGAGKVTLPIVKAFGRLEPADRDELWATLLAKPTDPAVIERAISLVEDCGAMDACMSEANTLVEQAWARLDPIIEDSLAKLRLRAFSWFVLERSR
jgi:geranylgeranyl pyrophosphate synthase/predicted secreted hydrolase